MVAGSRQGVGNAFGGLFPALSFDPVREIRKIRPRPFYFKVRIGDTDWSTFLRGAINLRGGWWVGYGRRLVQKTGRDEFSLSVSSCASV